MAPIKSQPNVKKAATACTLILSAVTLSGCLSSSQPEQPAFYQRLDQSYKPVDQAAALSLINTYRQGKGLKPLQLDPRLTAAAQEQADGMAEAGQVRHSLKKTQTLPKRLARANYAYAYTAENISAGYWTLAEAFSGWRDSKRHNKNMLNENVTHMGIATRYNPSVKYKVYWALVLASEQAAPLPRAKNQAQPSGEFVKLLGQP